MVWGTQAEGYSRLYPLQGAGGVDGGVFLSLLSEGAGAWVEGNSHLLPFKVWGVEPEGNSRLPLLYPRKGGTKRSPVYHGAHITGWREPPAHPEHLLMDVVTGSQRWPKTRLPYRQPYGIRWTL